MRKIFCDRCKMEILTVTYSLKIEPAQGSSVQHIHETFICELCPTCKKEVMNFCTHAK